MLDYSKEGTLAGAVLQTNFMRATQRSLRMLWEFSTPISMSKHNLQQLINSLPQPIDDRLTNAMSSLQNAENMIQQQSEIGPPSTPPHAGVSSSWGRLAAQIGCALMSARVYFQEWLEETHPTT